MIDSSTESPVYVLMLSIQAVRGLPRLHAPGIVPCIISFSEQLPCFLVEKVKGSPYSITERRVPELIPVLGSQPAGDVSHKPGGKLPLLFARPTVTPAILKRAATNFCFYFAAW